MRAESLHILQVLLHLFFHSQISIQTYTRIRFRTDEQMKLSEDCVNQISLGIWSAKKNIKVYASALTFGEFSKFEIQNSKWSRRDLGTSEGQVKSRPGWPALVNCTKRSPLLKTRPRPAFCFSLLQELDQIEKICELIN